MSAVFQNYPLVQKALEEQEGLCRFLETTLPAEFIAQAEKFAQTAEALLDGSPAEKEAVMVGCILMIGSPFIFDDISRFETEYTPEINGLVKAILNSEVEGSALMQQTLGVAVLAATAEVTEEDIGRILASIEPGAVLARDNVFNLTQCPLLKDAAPRLYSALGEMAETLVTRINARQKRPSGPGPQP